MRRLPIGELAPGDAPSRGPEGARRLLIMFSDFQCPFCKQEYVRLRRLMAQGDLRLVFRNYPLAGHPYAFAAARIAEMAAERGAFWRFMDIWADTRPETVADFERIADRRGVRRRLVEARLKSGDESLRLVQRDMATGQTLRINGVPALILIEPGRPARVVSAADVG